MTDAERDKIFYEECSGLVTKLAIECEKNIRDSVNSFPTIERILDTREMSRELREKMESKLKILLYWRVINFLFVHAYEFVWPKAKLDIIENELETVITRGAK